MKVYVRCFIAMMSVFSFHSFGQSKDRISAHAVNGTAILKPEDTSKDGLVIVAYYVEETINMTFGRRITKYEVSKLEMVNTYDLGPNNTRVVTPIYGKPKVKSVKLALEPKTFVDTSAAVIKPIKVDVMAVSEPPKYLSIDIVETYAKVLHKGYKSIDMLIKVADRAYFDGDLVTAAKYYEELISMTTDLDAMYYYRYAQSLKGIDQAEKANETMLLFESKNIGNNVVKHNKLVRN
ncbi:hypothetical protein B0A67_19235 [Flavobacterium aquidurense]|jgi:hypothetical protein|uniref:hypothetical protein n=1 Tax=Flavobacterium aquidurense TaxID=362413 RepID=UPI00091D8F65|nr:hypothetical protein [Flavobacterium aquidurense]OXA69621.1 hypothetical protein B0A67_19235 [Flavobacterium aquidurense]SHH70497.1 hypothetical protein SAMN05444481_12432 [Flavobacterium frigidimaris]